MAAEVFWKDKGWQKMARKLRSLQTKRLYVGLFAGDKYPDGTDVVDVAMWNHFGTERIPERPFISFTIESREAAIKKRIAASVSLLTEGRSTAGQQLKLIGKYVSELIKREITLWDTPANAESTVKAKGFNDPLLETGKMRESVRHEVR
jgi:hypothetical protein